MIIKRLVGYAIVCVLICGSTLFDSSKRVNAAFPGVNGKIVFVRDQGNIDIYSINADGSGETNLSQHAAIDNDPAWSPDGSKIVFVTRRDNANGELYLMNADGSDQTRLTNNSSRKIDPAWSPDGTKIVFVNSDAGQLQLINPDGSGLADLTAIGSGDFDPAWSPDGTKIAFASERDGVPGIYVMDSDGTQPIRLTDGIQPSWSPDGSKIAFTTNFDQIHVMNADGSEEYPRTHHGGRDPAWSPDGTKIAFTTAYLINGSEEIYLMNADGSGHVNVTQSAPVVDDYKADWQTLPLDTDGDGIPDDQDVETTQEAIADLPASSFKSGDPGHARAMTNILDEAEAMIAAGDIAGAIKKLRSLLTRVDGCGTKADKTDWIVDCTAQVEIRDLINTLIENLST
jgi:Tol biopolymer transport system component